MKGERHEFSFCSCMSFVRQAPSHRTNGSYLGENSLIMNECEILYSEKQFSGQVSHGMLLDMCCISEGCLPFVKATSTCERLRNASVCRTIEAVVSDGHICGVKN